jgi:RNA polymerase sigma-70 factor (ECF subfamily)
MNSLPEPQIARGLREGRADAWQAFYDAYAERLWLWVARQVGPQTADVADVVQETLMAAARSTASFNPELGTPWSWLVGIGRNHIALHFRKQERRRRLTQAAHCLHTANGQALEWLEGREPAPAALLATSEMATLVRATLADLPADYGTLLAARYLDDTPVDELADREQCTTVALRSKLARARRAFRDAFKRMAEDQ